MKKILLLVFFCFLFSIVSSDIGPKPSTEITVSLNEKPFENALISMQACVSKESIPNNNYSIAGIGAANSLFQESDFLNSLNEDVNLEEISSTPLKGEALTKAREFVKPVFDEGKKCYWAPAERAFGNCENNKCRFTYLLPSTFRLQVLDLTSNKIYKSNEVERKRFESFFEVNFDSSKLEGELKEKIELTPNTMLVFGLVFILNLLIEVLVGLVLGFLLKVDLKKLGLALIVGNIVSHPIVFFGSQISPNYFLILLVVLELFAILLEAVLIKFIAKTNWKTALGISLAVNVVSFIVGGIISFILWFLAQI